MRNELHFFLQSAIENLFQIQTILNEDELTSAKLSAIFAERRAQFKLIKGAEASAPVVSQFNNFDNRQNYTNQKENENIMYFAGHKIEKRKDGRYVARYYLDKKQKSVYARNQSDCVARLKKALEKTNIQKTKSTALSLNAYLNEWRDLYRVSHIAPASLRKEASLMKRISLEDIGKTSIKKLSTISLQKFLNTIQKDRQREHFFELLRNALNRAVKLKYIAENPILGVEIKKYESPEKEILTVEEEKLFVEYFKNNEYYNYFMILLYEGIRPGELAALLPSDIKNGYITINKSVDQYGNIKSTKTKAGIRHVPIFDNVKEIFENYIPLPTTLFSLRYRFNNALKDLHLSPTLTLYSLRHTFITRCAEKDVHPKVTQKWAGHKTLKITLQYYTHVSPAWEKININKLNNNDIDETHFDT